VSDSVILMDEFIFWMILIALVIIIRNQNRERQERETKDMTKKQKAKYFQNISKKQKANLKGLWIVLGIIILITLAFISVLFIWG
jgi:heme/copper-type cytochrome/quinol oxidase subunit 2